MDFTPPFLVLSFFTVYRDSVDFWSRFVLYFPANPFCDSPFVIDPLESEAQSHRRAYTGLSSPCAQ